MKLRLVFIILTRPSVVSRSSENEAFSSLKENLIGIPRMILLINTSIHLSPCIHVKPRTISPQICQGLCKQDHDDDHKREKGVKRGVGTGQINVG